MKYDLIAIDIDDTLVGADKNISAANLEAIERVKQTDAKIVLATGRPFPGAKRYMQELQLMNDGDFIITYQGALVQRSDTLEPVIEHHLTHEDLVKWHTFAKEYQCNFQAVQNNGIFTDDTDFHYISLEEPFVNQMPLYIRPLEELDPDAHYYKFIMCDAFDRVQALADHLPPEFAAQYTVLRSQTVSLEVSHKGASKGQSLKELAEKLEIPRERVMALGDSGNDIDMVDYAGLGIAVENAVPEVKEVADVIVESSEDDGVAKAIDRYFFEV